MATCEFYSLHTWPLFWEIQLSHSLYHSVLSTIHLELDGTHISHYISNKFALYPKWFGPELTANETIRNMKTSWARPKREYLTLEERCGKGAGEPGGWEGVWGKCQWHWWWWTWWLELQNQLFPFFFSNSYTFGAYFCYFLHVYKCNFNILVCIHLGMMYASIVQYYWLLNEACGRSNDGENWTVPEIVAENWACVKEPEMAILDSLERTVCCIAHTWG